MNKIKQFFKRLRCKHFNADLIRWHWTHGPSRKKWPAYIEAEYRCRNCGKVVYLYRRGKEAREWAWAMGGYKEGKVMPG